MYIVLELGYNGKVDSYSTSRKSVAVLPMSMVISNPMLEVLLRIDFFHIFNAGTDCLF